MDQMIVSVAAFIMSSLIATEVIPAGDLITVENTSGYSTEPMLGREVVRTVYVGQELTIDNTRPPRLVLRNQVVSLKYVRGPLEIATIGRAMGDAGANDEIQVLNLESRALVTGIVQEGGWVLAQ